MKSTLAELMNSKKFLAALLVGLLGILGSEISLDPEATEKLQYALMIFIGGQALADHGKEREKIARKKVSA